VSGIVKAVNVDLAAGRGARAKSLFLLYIDVVAINNVKSVTSGEEGSSKVGAIALVWGAVVVDISCDRAVLKQFSSRDLHAIQEIAESPNLFPLIVASMCPGIFGHEMVKAGLCLGLFGGSQYVDTLFAALKPCLCGYSLLR